jgi:hypothetical protein
MTKMSLKDPERILSRTCYKAGRLDARRMPVRRAVFAGVRGDMILLTTSWKLIFAPARKGEAPERSAEGSRQAETLSDCRNAVSAEREPQPSGRSPHLSSASRASSAERSSSRR